MDLTLHPRKLHGTIRAIPSKSQAHRLLICAAFADRPTFLGCTATNRDIEATVACLRALGADIRHTEEGYAVTPIHTIPTHAVLPCGESGSTLRFLLPI
ncbi:MAG: 3-phosphoshikimate 1-carboxyvinyltransferase, partial [Clostridia bacterium]|nr:3-phosphoshikimate 1-carboxyvinyltransferase [Clostridia bacterium]